MKQNYTLEVNLHDTLVTPKDCKYRPSYNVIHYIKLALTSLEGTHYQLRVFLEEEKLKALATETFTDRDLQYRYELLGEERFGVIACGKVSRSLSFETLHRRRVLRLANLQTVVTELLHEAIGSLVLCDKPSYVGFGEPCLDFLNIVSQTTPYAAGVSKAGPIVSHRFIMKINTNIPGLTGKRRFIVEKADTYLPHILGVHTVWTYCDPHNADAPTLSLTDAVNCRNLKEGTYRHAVIDGQSLETAGLKVTPMTAEEVVERMRIATTLPSA